MTALPKISTARILLHIATSPADENYTLHIVKTTGYPSGTVVPALQRMTERDGLLVRTSQPTTTGRPRALHELTEAGWRQVDDLVEQIRPRVESMRKLAGAERAEAAAAAAKVNLSTLWLLSALANNDGVVHGYSDDLRPLTHQAAYAELERLAAGGWLVRDHEERTPGQREGYRLTPAGAAASAEIFRTWSPLLAHAVDAIGRRRAQAR